MLYILFGRGISRPVQKQALGNRPAQAGLLGQLSGVLYGTDEELQHVGCLPGRQGHVGAHLLELVVEGTAGQLVVQAGQHFGFCSKELQLDIVVPAHVA